MEQIKGGTVGVCDFPFVTLPPVTQNKWKRETVTVSSIDKFFTNLFNCRFHTCYWRLRKKKKKTKVRFTDGPSKKGEAGLRREEVIRTKLDESHVLLNICYINTWWSVWSFFCILLNPFDFQTNNVYIRISLCHIMYHYNSHTQTGSLWFIFEHHP